LNRLLITHHSALRSLFWLLILVFSIGPAQAQVLSVSPHGEISADLACSSCHTDSAWTPLRDDVQFNHSSDARFELLGVHEIVTCESCHTDLRFDSPNATVDDCETCHENVHTTILMQTCASCHNESSFRDIRPELMHISIGFDLIGSHQVFACESCHQLPSLELQFSVPAGNDDCVTCHTPDYESAHAGSGFPTTCIDCHGQTTWDATDFDHLAQSGGFDLIGSHEVASCESCHQLPGLELLFAAPASNEDCVTCHTPDYESAHAGSGFPTTCIDCHGQTNWDATDLDHDARFFPIYSGEHRGEWNQCSDCHTSAPVTFEVFSCIDCHEHNRSSTDSEHRGISNYVYESLACFSCHPDGRE